MNGRTTHVIATFFWIIALAYLVALFSLSRNPVVMAGFSAQQAAVPLIIGCLLFCIAGYGIWKRAPWGRVLGIVLLIASFLLVLVNIIPDFVNGALDGSGQTKHWVLVDLFVLVVDGTLLWFLWLDRSTRAEFSEGKTAVIAVKRPRKKRR